MSEETFCPGQDAKDAAYEATIRGLIAGWPLARLEQTLKDAKLGAKVRGMESGTSLFCMRAGQWWLSTRDTEMPICDTPEEALGL